MRRALRSVLVLVLFGAGLGLASTPAAAEPQLTVTPDGTIVDGETITLRGTGFPPGHQAAAAQCRTEVLEELDVLAHCDIANIAFGTVPPSGRVRFGLEARRYIKVAGAPIDCAVPGTCVVGISSSADPFSGVMVQTSTELVFDPDIANDAPLTIDVELDRWTSRRLYLTVTCSRSADLTIEGLLAQTRSRAPNARVSGNHRIRCDGAEATSVLMVPHDLHTGPTNRFPRLLRRTTQLRLLVSGRAGRWRDTTDIRRTFDLTRPGLTRRASQPHDGVELDIEGLRVSRSGRAVARVAAACSKPAFDVSVGVTLLARGPGGTHRQMQGEKSVAECAGEVVVDVPVVRGSGLSNREDVLPAGRIEMYARAVPFPIAGPDAPVVMRPVRTERPIRPASIVGIRHNPDSRLRVGTATTAGVRASLRCGRSAPFTVFGTIGQPVDTVVHVGAGRTLVHCVQGRTITFDLPWKRTMKSGIRSAIRLQVINGDWATYAGPWQQVQTAWRTPA